MAILTFGAKRTSPPRRIFCVISIGAPRMAEGCVSTQSSSSIRAGLRNSMVKARTTKMSLRLCGIFNDPVLTASTIQAAAGGVARPTGTDGQGFSRVLRDPALLKQAWRRRGGRSASRTIFAAANPPQISPFLSHLLSPKLPLNSFEISGALKKSPGRWLRPAIHGRPRPNLELPARSHKV
jgi:hypothetical protein